MGGKSKGGEGGAGDLPENESISCAGESPEIWAAGMAPARKETDPNQLRHSLNIFFVQEAHLFFSIFL